ncbi:MAG TPA: hypothetical protein VEK39_14790 [Solirubrobacterales bacterium]|nr:hypothetical protein [Solirubrobacterales bacterium]
MNSGQYSIAVALVVSVALALGDGAPAPAAAIAAGPLGLEVEVAFTTQRPAASTGGFTRIVYPDYEGKPKALAKLVITLPEGTRIDEAAAPVCSASDMDFSSQGFAACPPETQVGYGAGTVVTGFGPPIDPIAGEGRYFHESGAFVGVFTSQGGGPVLLVSHIRIDGNRLIDVPAEDSPPFAPGGPPDGQTDAKSGEATIEPRSTGDHDLITTPQHCPQSGMWIAEVEATYQDGTVDDGASALPCHDQSGAGGHAIRLFVRPKHIAAGESVNFRFRIRGPAECRSDVAIRFAGQRVRTGPRGRARLKHRFTIPGSYRARASSASCGTAKATVRVTP